MEAAADEKYFLDLAQEHAAAEASSGQFLDGDARDNSRFFLHIPSCNAASGCNCDFPDLDAFHLLVNEKLNTQSRCELFEICGKHVGIKHSKGFGSVYARLSIESKILRYAQNHSFSGGPKCRCS